MTFDLLNTIVVAGIISAIVSFFLDFIKSRSSLKFERIFTEKEGRYRSILVFMSVIIDESNFNHIETTYKPQKVEDLKSYYIKEVALHLKFSKIYAGKTVIKAIEEFLINPTEVTFEIVANEMRQDLWAKKLKL